MFLDVSPHQERFLCSIISGSLTVTGALTSFVISSQGGEKESSSISSTYSFWEWLTDLLCRSALVDVGSGCRKQWADLARNACRRQKATTEPLITAASSHSKALLSEPFVEAAVAGKASGLWYTFGFCQSEFSMHRKRNWTIKSTDSVSEPC